MSIREEVQQAVEHASIGLTAIQIQAITDNVMRLTPLRLARLAERPDRKLVVVSDAKPPLSCDAESRAYEFYGYRKVVEE